MGAGPLAQRQDLPEGLDQCGLPIGCNLNIPTRSKLKCFSIWRSMAGQAALHKHIGVS